MIEGEEGDDVLQGGPRRDSLKGGPTWISVSGSPMTISSRAKWSRLNENPLLNPRLV